MKIFDYTDVPYNIMEHYRNDDNNLLVPPGEIALHRADIQWSRSQEKRHSPVAAPQDKINCFLTSTGHGSVFWEQNKQDCKSQ